MAAGHDLEARNALIALFVNGKRYDETTTQAMIHIAALIALGIVAGMTSGVIGIGGGIILRFTPKPVNLWKPA